MKHKPSGATMHPVRAPSTDLFRSVLALLRSSARSPHRPDGAHGSLITHKGWGAARATQSRCQRDRLDSFDPRTDPRARLANRSSAIVESWNPRSPLVGALLVLGRRFWCHGRSRGRDRRNRCGCSRCGRRGKDVEARQRRRPLVWCGHTGAGLRAQHPGRPARVGNGSGLPVPRDSTKA